MDQPQGTQAEMGEFFDFAQASTPTSARTTRAICPAHGNDILDGCLCHGFHEDFDLPKDVPSRQEQVEWNSDFSSWLPRYHKPDHPCDYCRSRSLECFIYDAGDNATGCSPCNALFRICSFTQPKEKSKLRTALDTLDLITEDQQRCVGGLTGKRPMRSLGHIGPIEDSSENGPKKGAAAARFSRAAVKVLKEWMERHPHHPYPTEEEKEDLKERTGLTVSQVSNWMANTRRRQKSRPKRSASPSIRPNTEAMAIPPGRTWDSMDPFERWKHSPPENEPAPLTAIVKAVEDFDPPNSENSSYTSRKGISNGSSGSFSVFKAPSTASLETCWTNMSSGSMNSHSTAWSHGSRNSFGSFTSNSKQERRRRRRVAPRTPKVDSANSDKRLFQCTFCTDKFKSKYDWSRHEKSLHLSLEKWICAPLGPVITSLSDGKQKCVYCNEADPSKEHLETHNHDACESKGLEARTFYRKDHLRQHLRLMHGCKMTPSMEAWKVEVQVINSRCGFCDTSFTKWQDRVDHLAKEFRNGAAMKDWKGCRGLDPHIAAQVTNAMPPYLIAVEAISPNPFSATNTSSMYQIPASKFAPESDMEYLIPHEGDPTAPARDGATSGDSSGSPTSGTYSTSQSRTNDVRATCWEILTLRLGRFAREHVEKYGLSTLTDEMLQDQARCINYGCDDPWNQTAADNPEWLRLFKQAHGLTTIQPHHDKKARIDVMEDLGLNQMSALDPSFDLSRFFSEGVTGLHDESAGPGSMNVYGAAEGFSMDNLLSTTTADLPAPSQNHFQFPDWDRLPEGFSVPKSSAAGFSTSLPANSGAGISMLDAVPALTGNPQVQRWDDSALGFGLDMDLDYDMNVASMNMQA